jgi:hypothetical protein
MIHIVTERLIRMKIVNSKSFINWLFSKEMANDFQR